MDRIDRRLEQIDRILKQIDRRLEQIEGKQDKMMKIIIYYFISNLKFRNITKLFLEELHSAASVGNIVLRNYNQRI